MRRRFSFLSSVDYGLTFESVSHDMYPYQIDCCSCPVSCWFLLAYSAQCAVCWRCVSWISSNEKRTMHRTGRLYLNMLPAPVPLSVCLSPPSWCKSLLVCPGVWPGFAAGEFRHLLLISTVLSSYNRALLRTCGNEDCHSITVSTCPINKQYLIPCH